ncbi:MAG TPA: two-component system response regulator [Blastocatellia bacterium]|nr:two-component system response regulator [Blastocatellia bacterium]
MKENKKPMQILMADDDEDDRRAVAKAWKTARAANPIDFVNDGEQLMDYLHRRGQFSDLAASTRPGLILLDLNMPKKDGREALKEIKADPELRQIPVIVLTTSEAEADVYRTYDLGANSFITKPVTFNSLVDLVQAIGKYWIEIVELPNNGNAN